MSTGKVDLQSTWAGSLHYIKILYFTADGTWLTAMRPSYDSDAKVQGSAALHATPAPHRAYLCP